MNTSSDDELLRSAVARLRAGILGIVTGILCGSGLLLATAWLLVQGGPHVGKHLELLRHYLPGYSVTWPGAFLGGFYGLLLGGFAGWCTAWIYNRLVDWRHGPARSPR